MKIQASAKFFKATLFASLISFGAMVGGAAASKEIVVGTPGGAYDRALKDAWFTPFEKETGIKVVTVAATDPEMRAKALAMHQAKNVSWDMITGTEIWAKTDGNSLFSEDMTEFCKPFAENKDLVAEACSPAGVKYAVMATLLAFNEKVYASKKPRNWADFWNTKDFPGPRAFPNYADPWRIYATALMADGVPADKLFPLDIDRAIRKLDELRPHISTWYRTGDQSQRSFRQGDYAMGLLWISRAAPLKAEGQPVGISFDQSFLLADTMQVLRGAPNAENARKLLEWYLKSPTAQAEFAEKSGMIPIGLQAKTLMSSTARGLLPPDGERGVPYDGPWINANQAVMLERWNKWLQN